MLSLHPVLSAPALSPPVQFVPAQLVAAPVMDSSAVSPEDAQFSKVSVVLAAPSSGDFPIPPTCADAHGVVSVEL